MPIVRAKPRGRGAGEPGKIPRGLVELFFLGVILGAFSSCEPSGGKGPTARDGVWDLRTWNPPSQGTVVPVGEWEFYWKQFLTPADFRKPGVQMHKTLVHLPDFWNNVPVENGQQAGRYGFATYRLKILWPAGVKDLGLKLPSIYTAYRIWINGSERPGRGWPGPSRETTTPQNFSQSIFFLPEGETGEIVIQVANFHDLWGGLREPLLLGTAAQIQADDGLSLVFILIIVGALGMGALYHLGLFLARALERSTLFFGLLCLAVALNALLTGEVFLQHAFPNISWEWGNRLEFLSYYFGFVFFLLYFYDAFRAQMHKPVVWALSGAVLALAVPVCFLDARDYAWELTPFEILVVTGNLYVLVALFRAIPSRRTGTWISLAGFTIFFLTILNEILSNNDYATITSSYFLSAGLFVFILFQSFVISLRFAATQRKADALSRELLQYSTELEAKVQERTGELQEAHRQKTDFFVNLAHETRTPLTLIQNYLDAFIRKNGTTKELQIIRDNFDKLLRDMVNYLDLEKLQRGQFSFDHSQTADLVSSIRNYQDFFQETAKARGMDLSVSLPQEQIRVQVDPSAVEKILLNLVDNAFKYSRGPIAIIAESAADHGVFKVRDSGPGIPLDQIPMIFLPYHQLSHKKSNTQGLGMGLAIVKKILDEAGGSIEVINLPGGGTEFRITVPLSPSKAPEAAPREPGLEAYPLGDKAPTKPISRDQGIRPPVLLVEDNDALRSFLEENLENEVEVTACRNGQEALDRLQNGLTPQLILSDIMMDEMDGQEFWERIRSQPRWQGIPFLFMTARTSREERIRNLESGVVDTILKPFRLDELRAKIRTLIQLSRRTWTSGLEEAARLIADRLGGPPPTPPPLDDRARFESRCREYELTHRQKEIVLLISKGYEYKEIGVTLGISIHTVDRHLQNLYEKTGSHNRIELLNILFRDATG